MWISTGRSLINLSLAKVIGISSSGGIRIDDFYISMNWEDVGYFLDGIAKIFKSSPSDYSVFDISEIIVAGGKDV